MRERVRGRGTVCTVRTLYIKARVIAEYRTTAVEHALIFGGM